jgi:hypothetical protein
MHTYFIDRGDVTAYLLDFTERLREIKGDMPITFCYIGESGDELLTAIVEADSSIIGNDTYVVDAYYDKKTRAVSFKGGDADVELLKDRRVVVIDSIVHSGRSMAAVANKVRSTGARSVCTYSLIICRGSTFIPNMWGLTINDHDRACFLCKTIPNNRLSEGGPSVHIRKLSAEDRSIIEGVGEIFHIDERGLKEMVDANERQESRLTYVIEDGGEIGGYATIEFDSLSKVTVQRLAVRQGAMEDVYAEALMRWSETLGRQADCDKIEIWINRDEVEKYKEWHFECAIERADGEYVPASHKIAYHVAGRD